jgi:chromosome segregation ATPase
LAASLQVRRWFDSQHRYIKGIDGVLYLAEVQKKTGGFGLGGGKAEIKLLACQRSEQSWSAVPGEEVMPADEANDYASGALVLVDITNNKQVRNVQPAGRQLVSILQNFSRLQEKFKTQEEEIEQWKQSLTYQSQELNRREMEMESRREQLQQMESDFEQLEQQRQELATTRSQVDQQREEYERNRQELDGAWNHLRGEMSRLDERKAEIQQSAVLDDAQARRIQELLSRLSAVSLPTTDLHDHVTVSLDIVNVKQGILTQHWQILEEQQTTAQQMQAEVDQQSQSVQQRWQEWHQAQEALEQAKAELKVQERTLQLKQEQAQLLRMQLQGQDELYQQMGRLADGAAPTPVGQQFDIAALEKMPMDELQRVTNDLEQDLKKLSQFVASQEEELTAKQQEIDALQVKIQAASEFDRMNLENDLADERDGYQMLNETLVGQRRSLREREWVVNTHRSVLNRRQGFAEPAKPDGAVDMGPLLRQVETQRQQYAEEVQRLEDQVSQMRDAIQQAHELVASQSGNQEQQRQAIKQAEQALMEQRCVASETWGKVNVYRQMLQPVQDQVDALRQRLNGFSGTLSQAQESGDHQMQAIAEMRQILMSLTGTPELAA